MAAMSTQRQRALGVALLCGGSIVAGSKLLQLRIKAFQKEQWELCESATSRQNMQLLSRRPKVSVDGLFAKRLVEILRICIPSIKSREVLFIVIQTLLLYSRTRLTEQMASIEGVTGQSVISKDWSLFSTNLMGFARVAIPAAIVNSGLKYMQTIISLAFQQRLAEHLHQCYLTNRVYYVASTLRGLSNADQRITEDVAKFSVAISELYSYTFKPVLDIIVFTRSLAKTIGYKGQFLLYAYFLFCSTFLRSVSPPLALMTAQEAALSGNFRNAHQRIVANAEAIAFNDPPGGDTERMILNDHLYRLIRHSRLSAFQRFIQQVADGYLIKYAASIVGICVYAAPFYYSKQRHDATIASGDYIRSLRLMVSTSNAIGQLVLVYKRVTALAGHSSRVSELLESVKQLSTREGRLRASHIRRLSWHFEQESSVQNPPRLLYGDSIKFRNVTISAPDATPLVRDLSFELLPGHSIIIMGPNGSGKSSIFRVLAELWPLQNGTITRPPRGGGVFYLSQRPYLVRGTLRDQVRYPALPLTLTRKSDKKSWSQGCRSVKNDRHPDDARVLEALNATEVGYLVHRGDGLDQNQNWEETLSGGEKQRLAVARLLFHNPKFAVLDECTSAVSADGEEKLYRQLHERGITMLSIAHRPALMKYHTAVLYLDGSQSGYGWRYEVLKAKAAEDS
ncbi:ABC transporter D family member 2 [Selaginella moellendorffii]|nr:ABC transporter D family member 2 [Selaginella moellendorffii]|eukprot:XP_002973973.2 ABC transporter D family member 2 [Selaginella moellendorffii]